MSKCKLCGVDILDKTDSCPLCSHVLEFDGIEKEKSYPDARIVRRKYHMLENIFLFSSIVLWCVIFAIDYITNPFFLQT